MYNAYIAYTLDSSVYEVYFVKRVKNIYHWNLKNCNVGRRSTGGGIKAYAPHVTIILHWMLLHHETYTQKYAYFSYFTLYGAWWGVASLAFRNVRIPQHKYEDGRVNHINALKFLFLYILISLGHCKKEAFITEFRTQSKMSAAFSQTDSIEFEYSYNSSRPVLRLIWGINCNRTIRLYRVEYFLGKQSCSCI